MNKAAVLIVLSVMIAGCAVGWGKRYEVLHKDQDKIIIQYGSMSIRYETILNMAKDHCAMTGREPEVDGVVKDSFTAGAIKTYTFRCR